jgi:hypothetical protein
MKLALSSLKGSARTGVRHLADPLEILLGDVV